MLWSSSSVKGYAMGLARSASGDITGPWTQDATPLYGEAGGHGMLFRDFQDKLLLAIRPANINPQERPLLEVAETKGTLKVVAAE